ncbi:MAG: VOC family protein [Chloroflexi bacterium]|nr:VOC family protein [Chloroflexota bacterium]
MILMIDHVQITIPKNQEEAGRAFYCDVLGLREIPKPESLQGSGGFWLEVGDRQIHVGTEDGFDRLTTKAHVAYRVSDLAHWRQKITAAGITIEEQIPIPGYDRFEFRDPFGNRVELTQKL